MGAAFIVPMIADQLGYSINPLAAVLLPMIQAVDGAVLFVTGW